MFDWCHSLTRLCSKDERYFQRQREEVGEISRDNTPDLTTATNCLDGRLGFTLIGFSRSTFRPLYLWAFYDQIITTFLPVSIRLYTVDLTIHRRTHNIQITIKRQSTRNYIIIMSRQTQERSTSQSLFPVTPSPPKPVPALHGSLALPYARNPK